MRKNFLIFTPLLIIIYLVYFFLSTKSTSLDQIIVVNLDRSPARLERMERLLDELHLPIPYIRSKATDGNNVKFVDVETKQIYTGAEIKAQNILLKGTYSIICSDEYAGDFKPVKLNWDQIPGRIIGEVGTICSHKQVWQQIASGKNQNILVLEDDIEFVDNFYKKLQTRLSYAPQDYDLLYLKMANMGGAYSSKIESRIPRFALEVFDKYIRNIFWRKLRKKITSTEAYILTPKAAQELLNFSHDISSQGSDIVKTGILPVDFIIADCIEAEKIKAYVSRPQIVIPGKGNFASDIGVYEQPIE